MQLIYCPELSLMFNRIPELIDIFVPSWNEVKNSVAVEMRLLHSQPLTNSHFHINMESVISQVLVRSRNCLQLVLFEDWSGACMSHHCHFGLKWCVHISSLSLWIEVVCSCLITVTLDWSDASMSHHCRFGLKWCIHVSSLSLWIEVVCPCLITVALDWSGASMSHHCHFGLKWCFHVSSLALDWSGASMSHHCRFGLKGCVHVSSLSLWIEVVRPCLITVALDSTNLFPSFWNPSWCEIVVSKYQFFCSSIRHEELAAAVREWLQIQEPFFSTATEFFNLCQVGTNASVAQGLCWKIMIFKWKSELHLTF
jgi:hypothetical protein